MANKDLNIGIKVDSSQLDQTVKKLGELKQLSNKVAIQYDIDGKPLDVVINKSLNLQQQVKALTAELRRTKEGTAEFTLLNSKLNDAKDNLERVNAKSKDLFASLSLIPGPIGDMFGKLNGAIGLLKTFSGFSFKDIGNQFKELSNDLKDIRDNFFGASGQIEVTTDSAEEMNSVMSDASNAISNVADDSEKLTSNFNKTKAAYDNIKIASKEGTLVNEKYAIALNKHASTGEMVVSVLDEQTGAIRTLNKEEILAASSTRSLAFSTDGYIVAAEGATVATFTWGAALRTLLAATGIGAVLLLVGFLIDKLIDLGKYLYDSVTQTRAFEEATKKLSQSLNELDASFNKSNNSLKRANNERLALLKSQGASEEKIRQATIQGLKSEREQTSKELNETINILNKLRKLRVKNLDETNKEIERAEKKKVELEERYKDQSSSIKIAELNNITENNKKIQENNQKRVDNNKKLREQEINDDKTANQMIADLYKQNTLLQLENERQRQYEELKIQAAAEVDKVNALQVSEDKKNVIRTQIFLKYSKKIIELNDKFNQEDIKKTEETEQKKIDILNKLGDIAIQAITNQTEKEKAERNKKYRDDVSDLDKALKDKLISQTQYDTAVKNLQIALANDLKKIDADAARDENEKRLKKLDDELKFMQIRNESMRQGTIASFKAQRELLDRAQERELAQTDLTEEQKTAIVDKYTRLRQQSRQKEFETYLQYISQGLSAFSSIVSQQQQIVALQQQNELATLQNTVANKEELAEKEDKVKEKYFYKNRNAQYAQALINSFQAAISAYSSLAAIPVVGPALGAIAAGVALGFGLKQASLIKQQQYVSSFTMPSERAAQTKQTNQMNYMRNYADGGMIDGPRHSQGGVAINAEGGEAIMTRGAVTMFKPLLSLMNQAGGGVGFQSNIMTTGFDNPKTKDTIVEDKPMIVKTYVVSNELTTEQQRQARLKDLSTL